MTAVSSGGVAVGIAGEGLAILERWRETAVWTLALLRGPNFLSIGLSLIMLARAAEESTGHGKTR